MATELERIAILEERTSVLPEMHQDLKIVVAYVNQQKGKSTVFGMIWTGVVAIIGGIVGWNIWHK
jgi:hypothetical protein